MDDYDAYIRMREKEDKESTTILHKMYKNHIKLGRSCIYLSRTHEASRYYMNFFASIYHYSNKQSTEQKILFFKNKIYMSFQIPTFRLKESIIRNKNIWIGYEVNAFDALNSLYAGEYQHLIHENNERIMLNA